MKYLPYLVGSFLFVNSIVAQKKEKNILANTKLAGESTVIVDIQNLVNKNGKFYLVTGRTPDSGKMVLSNKIQFKKTIKEPTIAYVIFEPNEAEKKNVQDFHNYYSFYLLPGSTEIITHDSVSHATIVKENAFQQDYKNIQTKQLQLNNTYIIPLIADYKRAKMENDQAKMESIRNSVDSLQKGFQENTIKPFIEKNASTSPVALTLLVDYAGSNINYKNINPLYQSLNAEYKALPSGKYLGERLAISQASQIGAPAIAFTQNDTLGKPVNLSDFKGKYVLVDFWASWCGPCRGENPNVVEAFNKYKNKNFTVLGVSFDQNKEKWLEAIHNDNLTWTHVSDLKYWDNAVGKLYGIQSIPQNILIDPNGVIIARNIRGEELQRTLAEVLK